MEHWHTCTVCTHITCTQALHTHIRSYRSMLAPGGSQVVSGPFQVQLQACCPPWVLLGSGGLAHSGLSGYSAGRCPSSGPGSLC